MAIYLIREKFKGELIDHEGRLESDINFCRPVYHMTMKYAQKRIESLEEPNNYEIIKAKFISLIIRVKQDQWEDLKHYRYVYHRWLNEEDVRQQNKIMDIMVETLNIYQQEAINHYSQQGIDPIFTVSEKSDEEILNFQQVMELCEGLETIPKPLTFVNNQPIWSSIDVDEFIWEQKENANMSPV